MGNSEEGKPEKSSSPPMDQNNIPVYPDWAMMQAYYGPRLAVPPYLNSAVSSGHAPLPYMWLPPQAMIPPYGGSPYAAFYAHGGVYGHSAIPIAGTGVSTEAPVKPSGNTDRGFMRKSKECDGPAMSIGNGNADSGECGTDHRLSNSEETEVSSGSNGGEAEVRISKCRGKKTNVHPYSTHVSEPSNPNDTWSKNERELKWERRKLSNRESARRSRLRKQAEAEELTAKVHALATENTTLKSEIDKLKERSENLKHENAALMEKLQDDQTGEIKLHKMEDLRLKPVDTVNLLSRVHNNDSTERKNEDAESFEKGSPVTKLHQLLDSNAVAAR